MIDVNALPLEGEGGLIDLLKTLVDPRKPRGVRHPVVSVVGIAGCAALSGARSFCAMGEWAQGLTREALERLGSKRWTPPSEPTIRRVLQGLDANRWTRTSASGWRGSSCALGWRWPSMARVCAAVTRPVKRLPTC